MQTLALLALLHVGPPIWCELAIAEDQLAFVLSGDVEPLRTLLGLEQELAGPLDAGRRASLTRAVEAAVRAQHSLRIDGREVELALRELELPDEGDDLFQFAHARFACALSEPPRDVAITWLAYDGAEWKGETFLPLTIVERRRVVATIALRPAEPEFTWHAGEGFAARPIRAVVVDATRSVRIPVLALSVAAATLMGYVLLWRRRTARVQGSGAALVGLLAAAMLGDVGTVEVHSPLASRVALPGPDQALAIFETLHRNVYDSFGASSEEEIYDLLSVSVDAELLDELYGEVYESLILREQGGAVCGIEAVEVLERGGRFPEAEDGPARFSVDWKWRVHGLVSHWGHVHRRTNEYDARYEVRHDGRSWKIAGVDVREHRRLDLPDAPAELVPTPGATGG